MLRIHYTTLERTALMARRYIMLNAKTWLVGFGAIAGLLIVIALLQVYLGDKGYFSINGLVRFGQTLIYAGGFLITSMAFNELHSPTRSQFFLTLPASTTEKLISHWLVTSIGYVILANILLSLVLIVSWLLNNVIFGVSWSFFNPFTLGNIKVMVVYVVTQSVFFLGAVAFRRNNFFKTMLSLFVLSAVVNVFSIIVVFLLYGTTGINVEGGDFSPYLMDMIGKYVPTIARILFYGLMVPFFLVVSYFKLKEREV